MPDRRRAVVAVVALVATVGLLPLAAPPLGAQEDERVDLGVYGSPIRFTAPEGVTIELSEGTRVVDTIEVRPNPNSTGFVLIAEMDTEAYVEGIAEMPARWPLEALKAQAVAARTYAWYQITRGTFERRGLGYDICPTVACQVFHGREVVEAPDVGQRWAQAVAETAGEVLLYEGEPILARYFSTSGGQTRDNEDVFPSEGPYPYLKGIDDPDDAVSPLHEWQAVFTRDQFDALLAQGETLADAVPVADATVIPREGGQPNLVEVTGEDGAVVEVTAGELQSFLNSLAPDQYPDEFPGPRDDGGRLPSTVPSSRYQIVIAEDEVVLDGSGWGHAVGMGQYGAMGKAERGMTYDEILATYYNGLRPETPPDLPDRIRVGLADDIDEVALSADGPLAVEASGAQITDRALGTWRMEAAPDRTIRLLAPTGYGAPLVVEPTTTPRTRPVDVEIVTFETVVNKPAEFVLQVRRPDGSRVLERSEGIVEAGRHEVTWDLGVDGVPVAAGPYEVSLVATDEDAATAGSPATIEVIESTAVDPADTLLEPLDLPTPETTDDAPAWPLVLGAGVAGLFVGAAVGAVPRARR